MTENTTGSASDKWLESIEHEFDYLSDIDRAEFNDLFIEARLSPEEFREKLRAFAGLRRFPYWLNAEIEKTRPDFI